MQSCLFFMKTQMGFLVAQLVKNQPAMRETWVQSMGWEDPWRRERLPNPVLWPGEFDGMESPWGRKEWDMTEQISLHFNETNTNQMPKE